MWGCAWWLDVWGPKAVILPIKARGWNQEQRADGEMIAGQPPSDPVSGSKILTFQPISFLAKPSEFETSEICHSLPPSVPTGHICTHHPL